MIHLYTFPKLQQLLLAISVVFFFPSFVLGQEEPTKADLERTFMPTLQLGYVFHGTDELSSGLVTQTSIEYRDISNFIFGLIMMCLTRV
ncbi:MAG: hypothetical protein AAF598_12380 [Bacteroidota bacterium]